MLIESYAEQLQDRNMIAWIMHNKIKNERGVPISFKDHAFMIDPYLDWTPEQAAKKASQCGWSVMTNLKLFFAAKHGIPGFGIPAANVIYTLPSDADVKAFVPSKTNLLISNNPVIASYVRDHGDGEKLHRGRDVDSIQRKQIDQSMVYFKGTKSKTAAIMLTADLRIHDESDRSDQTVIEMYESRTSSSLYKGNWTFSNPSAPNMPADLLFQNSDQKYWFIKCGSCGTWQYMDWFDLSEYDLAYDSNNPHCFVDPVKEQYVCCYCAGVITDDMRRRGKWIRKYSNRKISGYWVNQMMYPWISAASLLPVKKNKSKAYWLNFVMGVPYVGSDVKVDSQVIMNNMVLDKVDWKPGEVAMGVDNGDIKHYVIGNKYGIFKVGKTKSWEDIDSLIRMYQPVTVIDMNPYPSRPREMAKSNWGMGRVYLSFFVKEPKNYQLWQWGDTYETMHMVYPNRNKSLDDMIGYIAEGSMKFFGSKSDFEEYIKHWETMYRADMIGTQKLTEGLAPDTVQPMEGVWLSSTGQDHFAFATLYFYIALSKIIGGAGQVLKSPNVPMQIMGQPTTGGSIPVTPAQGPDPNTHRPMFNLKNLLNKKNSGGGGSTSGTM